jgi:UDP-N-acetylmuramoyl-tripeptide--D-alanyl-D-alanine ligase
MNWINIEKLYSLYLENPNVTTDTRNVQKGDIFFALKGANFNGNSFAKQALQMGAAYVIVDEFIEDAPTQIIQVVNVLETLQQLAAHHRKQFAIPFIAITGSNGKTTTKELLHAVLSKKYKTYTTIGNLNNHIGIPLTLLRIRSNAEIAIVEMGANHQKEIEGYCQYTQPTHALINNCGKAHLEGFGGIEGVRKGKGELYDYVRATNGTIFRNDDYDYLITMSEGIQQVVHYGTNAADTKGTTFTAQPFLTMSVMTKHHAFNIATHLVGAYNAPNVLAAICIGDYFGVMPADIKDALEQYEPTNSRSQMIEKNGWHIILDAYNANPSSMQLAIENFANMKAPYKVLMIGAMKEMGNEELAEHQQLVNFIAKKQIDKVLLTGKEFLQTKHNFSYAENNAEAKQWLLDQSIPKDALILIKGSRGIAMEKVIEGI